MTIPAWPSTVPMFGIDVEESPPDVMLRSPMDVGPAKVRRRTIANVRPIKTTIVITSTQVDTLDTFFWTTLEGGTLEFTGVNYRTGETDTWRITKVPSYKHLGDLKFQVSLSYEKMP